MFIKLFCQQVLILLHGDEDYRFVVVEDFGYVVSYNPRTIKGDVQTMLSVSVDRMILIFYQQFQLLKLHLQCSNVQIKGNMVSTYQMFPIVPTIAKGEIKVRISTYSSQRIDEEEVVIKVLVRNYYLC